MIDPTDACLTLDDVAAFEALVTRLRAEIEQRDYMLWLTVKAVGGVVLIDRALGELYPQSTTVLTRVDEPRLNVTRLVARTRPVDKTA